MLGILLLGIVGTGVELVLLNHYEDAWQYAPLILIVLALVALAVHRAGRGTASLRTFQGIMVLFVVAGLAGPGWAVRFREAVEEHDADGQRQLLARDRVRHTLEHRQEAWRLQAAKAIRQRAEVRVVSNAPVENLEVHVEGGP